MTWSKFTEAKSIRNCTRINISILAIMNAHAYIRPGPIPNTSSMLFKHFCTQNRLRPPFREHDPWFVCVDALHPSQQFFSHVETFPRFNKY